MKQYTTPDLEICLPGAAELLETCSLLSVYIKGNCSLDFDKEDVRVDGEMIYVHLSQGQTGSLGPGNIALEITLGFPDGTTLKSQTIRTTIEEALRKETL